MRAFTLAGLLLVLTGTAAWGHDERFSSSKIEVKQNEIDWTVDVGVAGLEKVVRLPEKEINLTETQLQESKPDVVAYLIENLKADINGSPVEPEPGALEPVYDAWAG